MSENTETVAERLAHQAGKYLTFRLHKESYGIAVLQVREIMRLPPITAVPRMPEHIKGVINLRGKIIPVIDLRLRFGIHGVTDGDQTCVIVVQVTLPSQKTAQIGLVVDAVEEVANIGVRDIEETPEFGANLDTAYILGMAKVKGAVKALLDINQVVAGKTAASLDQYLGAAA